MAKRLTEEEKQLRKWKNDDTLDYVLKCKCGRVIEGMNSNHSIYCKCGRYVFYDHKIVKGNCKVLYER